MIGPAALWDTLRLKETAPEEKLLKVQLKKLNEGR